MCGFSADDSSGADKRGGDGSGFVHIDGRSMALRLHAGLAIGSVDSLLLGGGDGQVEHLVAGPVVALMGNACDAARSGDLVVDADAAAMLESDGGGLTSDGSGDDGARSSPGRLLAELQHLGVVLSALDGGALRLSAPAGAKLRAAAFSAMAPAPLARAPCPRLSADPALRDAMVRPRAAHVTDSSHLVDCSHHQPPCSSQVAFLPPVVMHSGIAHVSDEGGAEAVPTLDRQARSSLELIESRHGMLDCLLGEHRNLSAIFLLLTGLGEGSCDIDSLAVAQASQWHTLYGPASSVCDRRPLWYETGGVYA